MRKKIQTCVIILALIGLFIGGTSIAFFTDDVKAEIARFVAGRVKIEFVGEPEVEAVSDYAISQRVTWAIKNESSDYVYVRVKVLDFIDLEQLNIAGNIKLQAVGWTQGEDGYFYYPDPIEPEGNLNFCLEITFDVWETIESFPVDIEVEAIQASNDAINQTWKQNPFR